MVWFSMGAAVSLTGVIGTGCQKKEEAAAADRIDFSEYDFTDAAAVRLQSMHTGHSIWLDEAEDGEALYTFCLEAAEAAGLSEAVRPAPSRRGFLWSLKMGPG